MNDRFEMVVKFEQAAEDSVTEQERVLFSITNSREQAQALADGCKFLIGQTVTDIYVRKASVQGEGGTQ